ncbi:MAG: DUF4912 domain-containing protein [Candidatus Omnitrophica bacterium]|nr:DUF4912 domain-containing protein [Candidatus Omnitrophota bacterium]
MRSSVVSQQAAPPSPPGHIAAAASTPPRPIRHEPFVIPTTYGDHRIVLMVKDPWWLHAYWEVDPSRERQTRSQAPPEEIGGMQSILRVYNVTHRRFPDEPPNGSFDISLSGLANHWYIQADNPGHEFIVDIGLLTTSGRFLLLARSNRVTTPRVGPAEWMDETLKAHLAGALSSASVRARATHH